jgi:hypothetical protein
MIPAILASYLLNAAQADYDGSSLKFSGQFQIEHPMGRLTGKKAELKDLQSERLGKNGANLYLEEGVFFDAASSATPFQVSSKRAFCELPPKSLFSFLKFQEVRFFEDVEIQTLLGIKATGGTATYKQGKLALYPEVPAIHCRLFRGHDTIDAKEIWFDLFLKELICISPIGFLSVGEITFSADSAHLTFQDDYHPDLLLLEGSVRIVSTFQGKKTFALADAATVRIDEKNLTLKSAPSKRVILWQEGLQISAPEVQIDDRIRGLGDVHFSLDTEEVRELQKLFSKFF